MSKTSVRVGIVVPGLLLATDGRGSHPYRDAVRSGRCHMPLRRLVERLGPDNVRLLAPIEQMNAMNRGNAMRVALDLGATLGELHLLADCKLSARNVVCFSGTAVTDTVVRQQGLSALVSARLPDLTGIGMLQLKRVMYGRRPFILEDDACDADTPAVPDGIMVAGNWHDIFDRLDIPWPYSYERAALPC
ncbi:MAG: hypothetical protein COU35_03015 [Candidatus Magasanikbacteria bacterium CG10_big_fil_rev_8_21_14_0_10_47_10]|uniref:Uncharacterized protein n=1 Tax=Candidatus Magasanikbacteria bacterium CG10_big_fil_rev_8_21_14_0_10_47_10 TaxID=1974652 RepID=A0A2H0TQI3_9BACT|nr:MAG: hypothetical protein COU35_03015 [Candidatus Magasanikbacteria bacterium CG10_big_fil_rev_8_21_14_0_10_47_10]